MIRVFPRRTKWTPTDDLAFIGDPPLFLPEEQPVMVSVTFTWDIPEGQRLQRAWQTIYDHVELGGPALGDPGGEFTPGRFIREGVTITSRGCIRKCKFCYVPRREGGIREYNVFPGHILQDNNILACSRTHQEKVFTMLIQQKKAIDFNGGLDPRLLRSWHIDQFKKMTIRHFWLSGDSLQVMSDLEKAADLLADFKQWQKRCYVLIGFDGETISQAEARLNKIFSLGLLPFAQLYQGDNKRKWRSDWDRLQRTWCRPAAYKTFLKGFTPPPQAGD